MVSCPPHCPSETQAPSVLWLYYPVGPHHSPPPAHRRNRALARSEKLYFYFIEIPGDFFSAFPAPLFLPSIHFSRPQTPLDPLCSVLSPSAHPGGGSYGVRAGQVGEAIVQVPRQREAGFMGQLVCVQSSSILQRGNGGGVGGWQGGPFPPSCGRREQEAAAGKFTIGVCPHRITNPSLRI